jgi:hypothetical protein
VPRPEQIAAGKTGEGGERMPGETRGGGTKYDERTVTLALYALAYNRGSPKKAQEALAAEGIEITYGTLVNWPKRTYRQRYLEIQAEVMPKIMREESERAAAMMARNQDLRHETHERIDEALRAGPEDRDLSKILQSLSNEYRALGEQARRAGLDPTPPASVSELTDLLNAISRLSGGAVIPVANLEGEATELNGAKEDG